MPSFTVVRKRAYWVREVMHIDADSAEAAESQFFDDFDPELVIEGVCQFGGTTLETSVDVTENDPPTR